MFRFELDADTKITDLNCLDMNDTDPFLTNDIEACASLIIEKANKNVVLGLPLGLGKPVQIVNELYLRAVNDSSISLKIFTALSLTKPKGKSVLEKRFIEPLIERLFGDYPELSYVDPILRNDLPKNIEVTEFFFPPGQLINVPLAQQSYTSLNYTHVLNYLLERGVNVIAHLISKKEENPRFRYSLSCNPDLTPDILETFSPQEEYTERRAGLGNYQESDKGFILVGQVHPDLPFMPGVAEVSATDFDIIVDSPDSNFSLYSVPHLPVPQQDYGAALHVASLIEDGGTLQIGIGTFADALTQAINLRHQNPVEFSALLNRMGADNTPFSLKRQFDRFEIGLYGCTEMFVHGFIELYKSGVLKREVFDDLERQLQANRGTLDKTLAGTGRVLDAGFFLGSKDFYRKLRELSDEDLNRLQMRTVSFINHLFGDEHLKRAQRVKARFINNALMATLLGATVSDQLENGQVVSGVGGQYNFVAQAHELRNARSIIVLNATRQNGASVSSNIRWVYGHQTIPRHLRDIFVTEYGVADVRGKSDRDVIAEMLNIADSRFQSELLGQAKDAGKIEIDYEIPQQFKQNTPQKLGIMLGNAIAEGLLPDFPLGTDLTDIEQKLIFALKNLKNVRSRPFELVKALLSAWFGPAKNPDEILALERLGLEVPQNIEQRILALGVISALRDLINSGRQRS